MSEARTAANRSDSLPHTEGFFGADALLTSHLVSGAIQFHGILAEKGDSGERLTYLRGAAHSCKPESTRKINSTARS